MTTPPAVRLTKYTSEPSSGGPATQYSIEDTCGELQNIIVIASGHHEITPDTESPNARISMASARAKDDGSGYTDRTGQGTRSTDNVASTSDVCYVSTGAGQIILDAGSTGFADKGTLVASGAFLFGNMTLRFDAGDGVSIFDGIGVSFTNTGFPYKFLSSTQGVIPGPFDWGGGDRDFYITWSTGGVNVDATDAHHQFRIGLFHKDGTQFCLAQGETDGVAAGRPTQVVRNDMWIYNIDDTNGSSIYTGVASIGAGPTLIVTGDGTSSDFNSWVGIKLPTGLNSKVFSFTTPTVTGQQTINVGFKPQFVMLIGTSLESFNTAKFNDALAGGFQISTFIDYGYTNQQQHAVGFRIKNNADPTDTASAFSEHALAIPSDSNCYSVVADKAGMTATGFKLNYTTVAASAKIVFGVAIEYDTPECGTPLPSGHPMVQIYKMM